MPTKRRCSGKTAKGEPCQATPRGGSGLCLWHDPELAEAAQEARRLGGQRRKREVTVQAAYDLEGLGSIPDIRRIVEIAVTDLLGAENTVARARTLLSAAQVAAKLLETGEFEERLEAIESVMEQRPKPANGRRR
jgi:hypothetical protein